MASVKRQTVIFLIMGMLILLPIRTDCFAQEKDSGDDAGVGSMIYDSLIIRPAGMAATVVGFSVFIVSLPFSAAFKGDIRKTFDLMVVEPAVFTFKRPLGKF